MKIYTGFEELARAPANAVATIGNFDGLHLGHRRIMDMLIAESKKIGGTAVVITFKPHPQIALRPEKRLELLNTYKEKQELLEQLQIDIVIEQPFSRAFSNISAEDFVEKFLINHLQIKSLYLGHDFAFGKERLGSADLIRSLVKDKGIKVSEVPALEFKGEVVSSTRIRRCLDEGNLPMANELLGRNFFVRGVVVQGSGRGRTIQVPTANLALEPRKLPRKGVYVTRTRVQDQVYNSVTNVGVSPTFHRASENVPIVVETHILDFRGDLYGFTMDLEFIKFLREEKKFPSVEALVEQIQKDIAQAKI